MCLFLHRRINAALSNQSFKKVHRFLLRVGLAALITSGSATAQTALSTEPAASSCSSENALEIIRHQIDATKTFDDSIQRITVLIRAADLLWPYKEVSARATFAEAFDLAERNFTEQGDEPRRQGQGLLIQTPDQRYVVIQAIARRDRAWANKLTEKMLTEERQAAEQATTKNPQRDIRTAEKLLDTASSLLSSDMRAASNFATASLSYPASIGLTAFLYKLAEVDQQAAFRFYERALAVYGNSPMREFLYLTAYPFGFSDSGDMPWTGTYNVPRDFVPNNSLQRRFVQTLLRRAQLALQVPLDEGDSYNGFPGTGHVLQALTRIKPHVQTTMPDLVAAVQQVENDLFGTLSAEARSIFLRPTRNQDAARKSTFNEKIEEAEKQPNINKRDELIVTAILNAGQTEDLDHVVNTAQKISDSTVRDQLLDWFYFNRTQAAIKDGRLDEASKLATKVREEDQRIYLYSEIAKESLRTIENQNQARDLIEEIVTGAAKGPNTTVTARTLLAAAYLYLKIDPNRSIAILGDAVKSINRIESPDFSRQSHIRKIEGRNFARYAVYKTPGFDPENAFREMGRIAFDGALSQASTFSDKSLRALTTLVLADICLQKMQQKQRTDKSVKKENPQH